MMAYFNQLCFGFILIFVSSHHYMDGTISTGHLTKDNSLDKMLCDSLDIFYQNSSLQCATLCANKSCIGYIYEDRKCTICKTCPMFDSIFKLLTNSKSLSLMKVKQEAKDYYNQKLQGN